MKLEKNNGDAELEKVIGEDWEKINIELDGVNPHAYRLGYRDCFARFAQPIEDNKGSESVDPVNPRCNCCSGKQVLIRGRYPKTVARLICPTCAYERLEQINDISSPNYGKTYLNS